MSGKCSLNHWLPNRRRSPLILTPGGSAWSGLSLPFPASQPEEGWAVESTMPVVVPSAGTRCALTPCLSSVPQNNEKLQESPCIFALTPRQVELIRNSRCSGPHPLLTPRAR